MVYPFRRAATTPTRQRWKFDLLDQVLERRCCLGLKDQRAVVSVAVPPSPV
jgi:hypothetical protein